jgi:hypothetical protein
LYSSSGKSVTHRNSNASGFSRFSFFAIASRSVADASAASFQAASGRRREVSIGGRHVRHDAVTVHVDNLDAAASDGDLATAAGSRLKQ